MLLTAALVAWAWRVFYCELDSNIRILFFTVVFNMLKAAGVITKSSVLVPA